jgi:HEPN domain-containing protein
MTLEDRIAQLERDLTEAKQNNAETRDSFLLMAGAARAFECALLALLSSTKHPEEVAQELGPLLNRLDSELVFESMSEAQIEGAQGASELLMATLGASRALPVPTRPSVDPECASAPTEQGGWVH